MASLIPAYEALPGGVGQQQQAQQTASSSASSNQIPIAFWCLGLLNNASFVIMLASAKDISEGGTALVFLAITLPSLGIKLSAPFWFDKVSYHKRVLSCSLLMCFSFVVVATFTRTPGGASSTATSNLLHMVFQLLGVALASAQCGLGEATLLALAGLCDSQQQRHNPKQKQRCITCFSSGTGLAGVFGFLWKFVWNKWLQFSLKQTLWMATLLAVAYTLVYVNHLWNVDPTTILKFPPRDYDAGVQLVGDDDDDDEDEMGSPVCIQENADDDDDDYEDDDSHHDHPLKRIDEMNPRQRLKLVLSLYPYMIPLFLVYAAEYSLQAGIWSAIGFPVDSLKARNEFFSYGNWMYQVGVFLSRSSGTLFTAPMYILWLMPILQCINVVFFWWVASTHVWYNYWLLVPCFYVGLLGGAVYVNGYLRICADLPLQYREFALSTACVADGIGILMADIVSLFLQSCLYQRNGLDGAIVSCPI